MTASIVAWIIGHLVLAVFGCCSAIAGRFSPRTIAIAPAEAMPTAASAAVEPAAEPVTTPRTSSTMPRSPFSDAEFARMWGDL